MRIALASWTVAILLAGCVSTEMKSFVGQDIREVILVSGPPIAAMDMGDGTRAFQFMWGGAPTTAQVSSGSGTLTTTSEQLLSKSELTASASTVASSGCVISYITRWNDSRKAWIVTDYRYPKRLVC